MHELMYWEIPSTDIRKSAEFYSELFGWRMEDSTEGYVMFDTGTGINGGISRVEKMPDPCIDVYIRVEDIPDTLARVESLGGRTEKPKTEIGGDYGFYAWFRDPCGCRIGVWSRR